MTKTYDVLIIGGGIMGASIAYNLANDGFDGKILVFERDVTYEKGSTCLSASGVRENFSTELGIKMSIYNIDVIEKFEEKMAVNGESPFLEFTQTGQMVLADENELPLLKNQAVYQKKLGAKIDIISPDEIKAMVPEMNIEGIAGAAFGSRGGKIDSYGFLQGYIKKGKSLGVEYKNEEVTKIVKKRNKVTGVETANTNQYSAPIVVNAAGPWAGIIGKTAGIDLPIRPLRRMCWMVQTQQVYNPNYPKIFNRAGTSFRPETGGGLVLTRRKDDEVYGFNFDVDSDFYYNVIWPEVAERIPMFGTLKLIRGWSGLYSVCTYDSNDIIGTHPEVEGLYLACGFSGHGMQQAPSVGKGISELIRLGRYENLDLSPFRFERFEENDLYPEEGLVGTFEYEQDE